MSSVKRVHVKEILVALNASLALHFSHDLRKGERQEKTQMQTFLAQIANDLFWSKIYLRQGKAKNKRPRLRPDMNKA